MPAASASLRRAWPALVLAGGIAIIVAWAIGWNAFLRPLQPKVAALTLIEAQQLVDSHGLEGLTRSELEAKLGKPDSSRENRDRYRYFLGTEFDILFGSNRYFLEVHLKGNVVNGSTIADD